MKLTPVLEQGLKLLKEYKVLYRRKDLGVPYNYVPKELLNTKKGTTYKFINGESVYSRAVNTQTVNRLVMLGYAELDEEKEIVKYTDRVESAIKFLESKGYKVTGVD